VRRNFAVSQAPRGVIAAAVVGLMLLVLPVLAMLLRVPWSALPEIVTDEANRSALLLSLRTSVLATLLSVAVGAPVAWLIAHYSFPGMRVLRALCVLPMVLPPVVGGVALIYVLGKNGVVGQYLWEWFGIRIAFTESAAVLAQFFVAAPYFIVVMESAFANVDPALVGVSRSLTITFAGNTQGRTQTLPLAVYTALESGRDAALLLSVVLIAVSFIVLVSLKSHWTSGVLRRGQQ